MATATIEVPHVYTALAEILKSLSVEKNGTLPGNMGGKAYITAVDASSETKRQFVANDLIFLPDEEVVKHETIIHKDRLNIAIVIKGSYTIISTVDGSSVTVSGTGDGLATGTAVASNIGSTNALKNALLRTFLITEQSVEDASKNGPAEDKPNPTQQKIDRARNTPPPRTAPTTPGAADLNAANTKIRGYIGNDDAKKSAVNDRLAELKAEGLDGLAGRKKLIEELGL